MLPDPLDANLHAPVSSFVPLRSKTVADGTAAEDWTGNGDRDGQRTGKTCKGERIGDAKPPGVAKGAKAPDEGGKQLPTETL